MAQISRPVKGREKRRWGSVFSEDCLGRECLNLHQVQSLGAVGSGYRSTGYRYCCATRDYHGCPYPLPDPDADLIAQLKAEGWQTRRA